MRRAALAFVALDIRDQVRDRSAMVTRLGPTLMLTVGILFGMATSGMGDDSDRDRSSVGVDRAAVIDDQLAEALETHGVDLVAHDDVTAAVAAGDVAAGLQWTDAGVEVRSRPEDPSSAAAARRAHAAVLAHGSATGSIVGAPDIVVEPVEPTLGKLRMLLSSGLPGAVLALLGNALTNSASQWHETSKAGALAHQLTLPVSRTTMLLAKTGAEGVLTLIATSPILLVMGGVGVGLASTTGPLAMGTTAAVFAALTIAAIAAFALGGLVLALRHPSRAASGDTTLLAMAPGMAVILTFLITEGATPALLAVLPVVGLCESLRAVLVDELDVVQLTTALTTTSVGIHLLLRAALRSSTDDLALRPR